ncbi:hypothetical protein OOT33_14050 [Sphingobium sp. DEHP117]|uniref:DUF4286 family protein n=1 Tax=Sphingobium sp. DEHP117 TaxID=2993436 RepID=UPI0027D5E8BE|nr:DUF4286 family protein [Sphingobium sp. DEHP117]MDQ4421546.1 hypothetical protein [Sphingobium sp. DEHP117]
MVGWLLDRFLRCSGHYAGGIKRAERTGDAMAAYSFIVLTNCTPGSDEEFNRWYDDVHLEEVVAINGISSAVRGDVAVSLGGGEEYRYAAIYEIDSDDPQAVLDDLQARASDGRMNVSSTLATAAYFMMKKERAYPG